MSLPRYPRYKQSGVEWLGQVPEHWTVKRLRFVAELNPSKSELGHLETDRLASFLPMEAIGDDGSLDLARERPIRELESGYTYFRDGDVTVAKITPCFENGKGAVMCGLANGIGFGTTELIVARPMPNEVLGPYLHALFMSKDFRALGESHMYGAGGQKRVPDAFVRNFTTAFPTVAEQDAIVSFLDRETAKIDELVAEQRRLIELLKEKRQAVISHAVTKGLNPHATMKPSGIEWLGDVPEHWAIPPLYVRYEQVLGKMLDQNKMTGEHPMPYLRNLDVRWDYCNVDDLPVMDIRPEEIERFTVRNGDLLTVEGRELGRAAIWSGKDNVVAFQKALHRLRPLDCSEHVRYFYYTMVFANATNVFMADQSPNEIPHLTGEQFRTYRFPKPPIEEQVTITEFLDRHVGAIDELVTQAERVIDLLQERRTALISAAVTGKIDVRELVAAEAR